MLDSSEKTLKGWFDTSLARKVGIGLGAMAVLMLLAIGGVFLQVQQQRNDATVINIAGRQRTLSQLIANRTLRAINGEAQAIDDLQTAADLFDRSLQGLQNGDIELGLSPAPASIQSELDLVNELWGPTYQNVQIVLEMTSAEGQFRTLALNLSQRSGALLSASEVVLTELEDADTPISTVSFARQLPESAQHIADLTLKIGQGESGVTPQLADEARRLDAVLVLLLGGGPGSPAWEQLLAAEAVWEPIYADIQVLLAAFDKGLQASRAVVVNSEPLLQASERGVTLFEQEAQGKVVWLQQFLVGVTGAFLLVFGVVLWATRRAINPLADISRAATKIAEGDMSVDVAVSSRDEIGRLAEAFNSMINRLRETFGVLESKVVERTRQLKTLVEVSQRLSGILDLSELMREVVILTKETFNYYHVHIYLLDDARETLIMAEGYGEAGAEMKRLGHNIALATPKSLVARAAREGRIITVANVREDPAWLPNPLLPETHSEMAVPVQLGIEVVGVLDVQSERVGGLTEEDETSLQALANQVATAIRNARLFSETQEALYRAQELQRLYTGQAWEKFITVQPTTNYEVRQPTLPPLEQIDTPEAQAALQQGQTVDLRVGRQGNGSTTGTSAATESQEPASAGQEASDVENALATPLKVGGEIIGVLGVRDENSERRWTEEEIVLVEAIAEQMSLAVENARLFEETQRNAWRDRVVSESTAEVWSSAEFEEVMKAAVAQLGDKLQASEVVIRLGTEDELARSEGTNGPFQKFLG